MNAGAAGVRSVFARALRNHPLRRLEIGYALFFGAEGVVWLALLVYAYRHGGAGSASVMAIVQLVPCALAAPFIGALADHRRPGRVLFVSYILQAVAMAVVGGVIAAGAPVWTTFVLAPVICLAITASRPAHAALLPSVVRTPEELTAANVLTGWGEGAGGAVAPALAGVLLAVSGPALALASTAVMTLVAACLVAGISGPAPLPSSRRVTSQLSANLRTASSDPSTRVLLILHSYYFALVGAVDLLCIILAISVLRLGAGGAGYLNAALGVGVVIAGSVTALLVARPKLSGAMMSGLLVVATALVILGVRPSVAGAFLLIAAIGLGGSVFDVTSRTLLQRAVPSDAVAGVFSLLESIMNAGLAVGVLVVRFAVLAGGYRMALFAPGALGVVLGLVMWRRTRAIDEAGDVRQVEIQLLRSIPIFHSLPAPSIEGLAHRLERLAVDPGTVIVREGDPGDRYFAVADGNVAVTLRGRPLAVLGRGDGFGEIALLHAITRTATVTAQTPTLLYALDKESFVLTVTGHPAVEAAARTVASRHMRSSGQESSSPDNGIGSGP
jgi:MFS family permease